MFQSEEQQGPYLVVETQDTARYNRPRRRAMSSEWQLVQLLPSADVKNQERCTK